jgi:hypothetical protein
MASNVHSYDGKLVATSQLFRKYLIKTDRYLLPIVASRLRHHSSATTLSKSNLGKILRQEENHNYDPFTQLDCRDLLALVESLWIQTEEKDTFLELVNLQLAEMSSGMCPQGRVYRLMQVLLPYLTSYNYYK